MGDVYVYALSDPDTKISLTDTEKRKQYASLYTEFHTYLSGITMTGDTSRVTVCGIKKAYTRSSKFAPDDTGCLQASYDDIIPFLGDIMIKKDYTSSGAVETYALEYTIGRKDFVAERMFEDGKIDGFTFKKIIFDGLEFQFNKYTENIKYPYFVMYIKEYLETKYGKDIDITQGLKVYTTLDPVLQEK